MAIVDYQNGSVYFNLINGLVLSRESTTSPLYFATHQQTEAHDRAGPGQPPRLPVGAEAFG